MLSAPSVVWAQPAASVQQSDGDNGIRVGEGRLHPFASVDTHYVVNPGRVSESRRDEVFPDRPNSDGYVEATGGLEYQLPSPTLELNFLGQASTNQYFEFSEELSGINALVETDLTGFKGKPFEFRLNAGYIRSQQPANQTVLSTVDHNDVKGGAGITIRPGGGALTISADYNIYYQHYDDSDDNRLVLGDPDLFNQLRQSPSLRIGWKFLPKTSVFAEARMDITRYPDDDQNVNFDANNLAAYIGISGAITTRLSLLAKIGYGNAFTDNEVDVLPLLGQLELGYFVSATAKVKGGFLRRISPQPFFGFVNENTFYTGWNQSFGAVQLDITGEAGFYEYGDVRTVGPGSGDDARSDFFVGAGIAISYAMTDWLTLGVGNNFELRESNNEDLTFIDAAGDVQVSGIDFGYLYNDLFVSLSARY